MTVPTHITFSYTEGGGHGRDPGTQVEAPPEVAHARIERGWARPDTPEDEEGYRAWLDARGLDVPEALLEAEEPEESDQDEPDAQDGEPGEAEDSEDEDEGEAPDEDEPSEPAEDAGETDELEGEGEGPDEEPESLPDDFPARDKLAEAGLETIEEVAAAAGELTAISGIGEATEEKILSALTGLGAG